MPVCSSCKGLNKKCAECMGTGCVIKKKSKTGRHVLCPICKQSFEGASLYAHLIDMHSKRIISLKNIKRPGRADRDGFSEKDNEIRQEEPNADLKRRINNRKVAIRRGLVLEGGRQDKSSEIVSVRCRHCRSVMASDLLEEHINKMHKWRPKRSVITSEKKKKPPAYIPSDFVTDTQVQVGVSPSSRLSICPKCGGDGGVRGGCRKCDGSGWVPEEREHDVVYGSSDWGQDDSRVSNADYAGGNAGGHFREHDGRIGSIPLHDDYGEEGES